MQTIEIKHSCKIKVVGRTPPLQSIFKKGQSGPGEHEVSKMANRGV